MSRIGFERIFNWWYFFILLSFNLKKFLFFFFSISHFVSFSLFFFQNGCVFVSSFFGLANGLLNLFVNDIKFIVLMNFLQFLLILLQLKFCMGLFLRFFLDNLRGSNSCVHLDSFRCLLLILLCEDNINRLLNDSHVLYVVMVKFVLWLDNVFFY